MRDYIQKACEEIDAAMFSGDAFMEKEARDELTVYISSWIREMKELEKTSQKVEDEPDDSSDQYVEEN